MSRLLDELKRRRVFRVAAAYLVVAWLSIQIADTVLPRFAPDWTVTVVILLAAIGLPVALALAWAFDITSDGITRTPTAAAADAAPVRPLPPRRAAWFAAGILVALSIGWYLAGDRPEAQTLDTQLVAVMPFRTGGADASMAYLREGMVDLLAATLIANDGTHAVDPATALTEVRRTADGADLPVDSARAVARRLGAAYVVIGSVTGTDDRVTVAAELVETATGTVRLRHREEDAADSIPRLVERMAGALLSVVAGEAPERATALAGVPLPAVRDYLQGSAAYREARFDDAGRYFGQAFATDPSFVLAALGIEMANRWVGVHPPDVVRRADSVAWYGRERLPPVERTLIAAVLGPRYPGASPNSERLALAREAARMAPERNDLRFLTADYLYHWGEALGIADAHAQAAALFDTVIARDPTMRSAAGHRMELALQAGDTATLMRMAAHVTASDSTDDAALMARWYAAAVRGDTATLRLLFARADNSATTYAFAYQLERAGLMLDWAERALERTLDLQPPPIGVIEYYHALNRGRASDAAAQAATVPDQTLVTAALYGGADTMVAAAAAARIEAAFPRGMEVTEAAYAGSCALQQWHMAAGRYGGVTPAIQFLRSAEPSTGRVHEYGRLCAALLEAAHAVHTGRADAALLLQRIDSTLATDPVHAAPRSTTSYMNLVVASLFERSGQPDRALRAVRRRALYLGDGGLPFYASSLLDEGRLAAASGDRTGAVDAYSLYLRLMSGSEPPYQQRVAYARREVQRLAQERGR